MRLAQLRTCAARLAPRPAGSRKAAAGKPARRTAVPRPRRRYDEGTTPAGMYDELGSNPGICCFGTQHWVSITRDKRNPHELIGGRYSRKDCRRHYLVKLKKSAEGTGPYVDLVEMGPSLDLAPRRVHHASEGLMKDAMTRPKATSAAPKKVKNVEHGRLSGRQGRIHMPKQNLNEMALARPKALRKRGADGAGGDAKRPRKN